MPRLTAAERREAVLEAASVEFAARGYEGTSAVKIARRVGISQPYIFRLFGTKRNLFEAAVRRCLIETLEAFEHAAAGKHGREAIAAPLPACASVRNVTPRRDSRALQPLYVTLRGSRRRR